VRLLHRCVRKRLSFSADFVASEFPAPAWRNWQTRWTQNPVIARSCGFEPLRRQSSARVARTLLGKFPDHSEGDLAHFLVELCINPKLSVQFSEEKSAPGQRPTVPSHPQILDVLREFQNRYEAQIKLDFVLTTIGKEVFDTLDHALAIGKMVVIEGESGSGKTTAVQAWCEHHQDQARFVSLSGIIHKTGFFRQLATVIGLAASNRKAIKMQIKVEEFFRKTRLMLVVDEAHYLFRHQQRSESSPELVDWVNTALVNHSVPVALICTNQFAKLKTRVEERTGWTSEQLEHRITRYKRLPSMPTKEDLEAVAAKLLALRWDPRSQQWNLSGPAPHPDFVKMVVGYALTCKMRLPAVAATVKEARYQTRKAGRSYVVATDIRTALLDYQIPSDEAIQSAFQSDQPSVTPAVTLQSEHWVNSATPLQWRCNCAAVIAHFLLSAFTSC
jgi:hypothetical protein